MGNSFIKKNYEESPWLVTRRTGNLLRLWAEVFHVAPTGSGTVKWQQVSDDLVPVSLTCVQDSPSYVFHVTAYTAQVDKVLDVRIHQPGTRIGQASECFVYWKDTSTGDTWGLNFTSPMDARQFREVCSPSFKYSRKNDTNYSMKSKKQKGNRKKSATSTPTSPSTQKREPQCTCMTNEQYARLRGQNTAGYKGSSTLPRGPTGLNSGRSTPAGYHAYDVSTASSAAVGRSQQSLSAQYSSMRASASGPQPQPTSLTERPASALPTVAYTTSGSRGARNHSSARQQAGARRQGSTGAGDTRSLSSRGRRGMLLATAAVHSVDLTDAEMARQLRCRSSDDLNEPLIRRASTSNATRSSRPVQTVESPVTSPDIPRRHGPQASHTLALTAGGHGVRRPDGYMSEPETRRRPRLAGFQDESPASENYRFDNICYATTPSSSNSDFEINATETEPNSPTYTRLLMEYERHLRSALARGDDAESYSLHTFEAMISRSNDNLAGDGPTRNNRVNVAGGTMRGQYHQEHHNHSSLVPYSQNGSNNRSHQPQRNPNVKRNTSLVHSTGYQPGHSTNEHQARFSTDQSNAQIQTRYRKSLSDSRSGTLTSFESGADSKMCYLTSSEISDDEKLSLTTMVTDDDDDADCSRFPQSFSISKPVVDPSVTFNCTGAVRKAGFLSVKKWLLRKKNQLELARKRGWRGYWVCLKGTTLLFYPCESCDGRSIEQAPKHLIIVDGAVMQSIPEHPKKENVFCLSTAFGDAYLFQSPCQSEMESWINSIHCACAASFVRHRGKAGTLHMLQEEIFRQEREIETEASTVRVSLMELNASTDEKQTLALDTELCQHERTLERLQCEQFRLRCYMASLQGGELPNPKSLLTNVSKSTKLVLNRLGVFSVSSLHAYVSARSPSLLTNLLASRGTSKRRAPMLSRCSSGAGSSRSTDPDSGSDSQKNYRVRFLANQSVNVQLKDGMTVEKFLQTACLKKNVDPSTHFVRIKKKNEMTASNFFVPHRSDPIESYLQTHEVCEVCAKVLFQVELARASVDQMWGFSVEAELVVDGQRQDELCCYISRVEDISLAGKTGLIHGDEIMVINGAIVSDLDMMFIESVLQEELALCLMVRSSRTEVPEAGNLRRSTDEIIESLVCPPPPLENPTQDHDISSMIAPSVQHWKGRVTEAGGCPPPPSDISERSNVSSVEIDNLLKSATQVTGFCRSPLEGRRSVSPTSSVASTQSQTPLAGRQLSDADKLRKVLYELLNTERTYVKHLNSLIENYLEPLTREAFITPSDMTALFGNIAKIFQFQIEFLSSLEEAIEMEPNLERLEFPTQFKNVLFSIGNAFLYHNNSFKLYSSFCASHARAQKLLTPSEGNSELQQFLQRQNPGQQHSSTLESYLIKPIQRILKYPLLLQQLKTLSDPQSGERHHLEEALKGMEKVAEHINEMQRIHEEYGAIFDHLSRQHQKTSNQVLPVSSFVELSPGDLIFCGRVDWINISEFLGKVKKGLELHTMCFVFKTAVVFLCKERLRQRKKLMGSSVKSSLAEVEIIRYQSLIPVTEVQVRSTTGRDNENHQFWELIHLKSQIHRRNEKVYHLSNSSADVRNAFLKTIRQIIRESVRNMSVPLNKTIGSGYRTGTLHLSRAVNSRRKGPNYATLHRHSVVATTGCHRDPGIYRDPGILTGDFALRHFGQNQDTSGSVSSVTSSQSLIRTSNAPGRSGNAPVVPADDGSDIRDDSSRSEADEEVIGEVTASVSTTVSSNTTAAAVKDVSFGQLAGRLPRQLSCRADGAESDTAVCDAARRDVIQARLVQASNDPQHFQPQLSQTAGSPVWKPREITGMIGTDRRQGRQFASKHSSFSTSTLPVSSAMTSRSSSNPGSAKYDVIQSSCTLPRPPGR